MGARRDEIGKLYVQLLVCRQNGLHAAIRLRSTDLVDQRRYDHQTPALAVSAEYPERTLQPKAFLIKKANEFLADFYAIIYQRFINH